MTERFARFSSFVSFWIDQIIVIDRLRKHNESVSMLKRAEGMDGKGGGISPFFQTILSPRHSKRRHGKRFQAFRYFFQIHF